MSQLIYDAYRGGVSQEVYIILGNVAFVIATICSLLHAWKLGMPFWKAFVIIAALLLGKEGVMGAWNVALQYLKDIGFLGMTEYTASIVRVFAILPLLALLLAPILRLKRRQVSDAMAMLPLLQAALCQVGCMFAGCCGGYECSWGVYVAQSNTYCFPVSLLETALSLTAVGYLLYRTVKRKYVPDGKLYPLMMVLFGILRFVCEMLRDNQKLLLGSSGVGLHAIFMVIVGIVWLLIEHRIEKRKAEK